MRGVAVAARVLALMRILTCIACEHVASRRRRTGEREVINERLVVVTAVPADRIRAPTAGLQAAMQKRGELT